MSSSSPHFFCLLSTLSIVLWLTGCSLPYLLEAGVRQADILLSRKPIDSAQELLTSSEQEALALALEARSFAQKLDLPVGKTYSSLVIIDDEYVSWLLMASPRTELKAKTWCYPVVGTVPYRGFFDKEKAEREALALEGRGYDTLVRGVAAYSTLGWFDDPLFSNTLRGDRLALVNTIFHELFHQAFWVPNSVSFNETAAQVFGNQLTKLFAAQCSHCPDSFLLEAEQGLERERAYGRMLSVLEDSLTELYGNAELSESEKLELRSQVFDEAIKRFRLSKKRKAFISVNNAELLQSVIYYRHYELFEELWTQCDASPLCYLEKLKAIAQSTEEENFLRLAEFLGKGSAAGMPHQLTPAGVENRS